MQDSENIVGVGDQASVSKIAAQSEVIGKNQSCYEKSRVVQNQTHLKHSFLSIHTMPVAAGSLAYVEHYRSRVYESKSTCYLNPSQRHLFLVTNEALIPPPFDNCLWYVPPPSRPTSSITTSLQTPRSRRVLIINPLYYHLKHRILRHPIIGNVHKKHLRSKSQRIFIHQNMKL